MPRAAHAEGLYLACAARPYPECHVRSLTGRGLVVECKSRTSSPSGRLVFPPNSPIPSSPSFPAMPDATRLPKRPPNIGRRRRLATARVHTAL